VWSTDFLNKAMMHFGTNEVVPACYRRNLPPTTYYYVLLSHPRVLTCYLLLAAYHLPLATHYFLLTAEVVPVYYTTFTIASVAAGGLVYNRTQQPQPQP
jgi:hypothetical protein